jgi:hypothetical protein
MDDWIIFAASGEYSYEAATAGEAFAAFAGDHPDDFVFAVVNDSGADDDNGLTVTDRRTLLFVVNAVLTDRHILNQVLTTVAADPPFGGPVSSAALHEIKARLGRPV